MSTLNDTERENAVLGDSVMRHQETGQVEIYSDTSGVTINGASGNIDFHDENTTDVIRFSDNQSGNDALQTVNGHNTVVGLLNQVGRFFVSSNDTNAKFAEDKIVSVSGITLTVLNEGADEQLQIGVSASELADILEGEIVHNNLDGLQGGVSGQYYHLTSQQIIDLTSGLSADDQHFHNASAIVVDDTCYDILSGTDLQDNLCQIDERLKITNTMLVNFDIGGSVRNAQTKLNFLNDIASVEFDKNQVGIAAFTARVPENYIAGTALVFTIKWYSIGANTDDVVWNLLYKGLANGENVTTAVTIVSQTIAEPGVIGQLVETTFAIPGSAFVLGDVMSLLLKRLGNDGGDTSTEHSRVVEVSLDY